MQTAWDLRSHLLQAIKRQGGWVNAHTHLDRAYTITQANFRLADQHLHQKWKLVDQLKRSSRVDQIYDRMALAIELQLAQGVKVIASFIDVDQVIKDKAIKAAQKVRER